MYNLNISNMRKIILSTIMFIAFCTTVFGCSRSTSENSAECAPVSAKSSKKAKDVKIQVAILLDTSSSMDGLIDQAKSRLWNIVNTLTTLKYNGQAPQIEIALYEYGNSRLSSASDYIRQVTPLTADLDLISDKLFALSTNGGLEYCGSVIAKATKQLEWGNNDADMKLIYIAGNEPFTQGSISYKSAINEALADNIFINTIHCGSASQGIDGMWRDGATRGKGKFFNIDHNARVRYVDTPYDDRISECNSRLNDTYIGYGYKREERMAMQSAQDVNAAKISKSNYAERAVSKTKDVYNNSSWDLVDRLKEDKEALAKLKKDELPTELQNKSQKELEVIIVQKEKDRSSIQKEIAELAKKRQDYIDEQLKNDKSGDDLGKAINSSIVAFANTKGYSVGK